MGDTAQTTTTRMYASIRDQLAGEITAGVYPAGALLPSIREIMERWDVSTTTARKVLDELATAGYARKEGTRGAISTGGPQPAPAPSAGEPARKAPPRAAVPGRLTVWPVHTIPAHGSVGPDTDNGIAALDVRAEQPPADAGVALGITDLSRQVIVRRRLNSSSGQHPRPVPHQLRPGRAGRGHPDRAIHGDYRCVACRADHLPRQADPPGQQPGHRPPPQPRRGSRTGATLRRRGTGTRGHLPGPTRDPGRLHPNGLARGHDPAGHQRLIRTCRAPTRRPASASPSPIASTATAVLARLPVTRS